MLFPWIKGDFLCKRKKWRSFCIFDKTHNYFFPRNFLTFFLYFFLIFLIFLFFSFLFNFFCLLQHNVTDLIYLSNFGKEFFLEFLSSYFNFSFYLSRSWLTIHENVSFDVSMERAEMENVGNFPLCFLIF